MSALNYCLLLFLIPLHNSNNQSPPRHYLFLSKKGDTASVYYEKRMDTSIFDITILYPHRQKPSKNYNYTLTIINKEGIKPQFALVTKEIKGKVVNIVAKDSIYFAKRRGTIKSLYPKIAVESSAFIYNGSAKFSCFTIYKLQKNYYGSVLKITYSPIFGPTHIFINNGGENIDTTFIEDFNLVSIDGEILKDYLKRLCK
jgi:hypothetical protein